MVETIVARTNVALIRTAVLITICGLASVSAVQSFAQKMDVDGYLVDDGGVPVRDGKITVFHGPPFYKGGLIVSWPVLDDGYFGLVIDWKSNSKVWLLMEERPAGSIRLVPPSFLSGRRIGANVTELARLTGLDVACISRRHDAAIRRAREDQSFGKVVTRVIEGYHK